MCTNAGTQPLVGSFIDVLAKHFDDSYRPLMPLRSQSQLPLKFQVTLVIPRLDYWEGVLREKSYFHLKKITDQGFTVDFYEVCCTLTPIATNQGTAHPGIVSSGVLESLGSYFSASKAGDFLAIT